MLLREPGFEQGLDQLIGGERVRVRAPSLVETGIVLTARIGPAGKSLPAPRTDLPVVTVR